MLRVFMGSTSTIDQGKQSYSRKILAGKQEIGGNLRFQFQNLGLKVQTETVRLRRSALVIGRTQCPGVCARGEGLRAEAFYMAGMGGCTRQRAQNCHRSRE